MADQQMTIHPETADPETLVDRLRGIYRIPIRDGLGPVGGGDEPNNPDEYVRRHATPPIQHAAADEIERLRALLASAPTPHASREVDLDALILRIIPAVVEGLWDARDDGAEVSEIKPFIDRDASVITKHIRAALASDAGREGV
jgi:hypothetical protein